jgi:hypothetical protein
MGVARFDSSLGWHALERAWNDALKRPRPSMTQGLATQTEPRPTDGAFSNRRGTRSAATWCILLDLPTATARRAQARLAARI